VHSLRFFINPNSFARSDGPEKISRFGTLDPSHPKFKKNHVGVSLQFPVTTSAGLPTLSTITWDGDRNRFIASRRAFIHDQPLYEIDYKWSQEFEPLEPQAGELVIAGGAREYDHFWEAAVPSQNHAALVLTIPQREGRPQVIERKLVPGRHNLQLQAKPNADGKTVKLKLHIDDAPKEEFDVGFAFGDGAAANPSPIVKTLSLKGTTADGSTFQADAISHFLVQRPLQENPAPLILAIKLQASEIDSKPDEKPRP